MIGGPEPNSTPAKVPGIPVCVPATKRSTVPSGSAMSIAKVTHRQLDLADANNGKLHNWSVSKFGRTGAGRTGQSRTRKWREEAT
jgi:hypothetical protein